MSVFVKICGLRDANSVAVAVAAGADAIGFVFAESVRRVSVEEAQQAAEAVPAGIQRVAVMRHPSHAEWGEVLDGFRPDVLQTDAGDFEGLDVPPEVSCWPVIREGAVAAGQSIPEVFVYEGPVSGAGMTVNWDNAARMATRGRMILAGGLDADNVANAISQVRPWGVDVSSGVESAPGVKDFDRIRKFVGAVRAMENN